jgi:COMPASS component SWD3
VNIYDLITEEKACTLGENESLGCHSLGLNDVVWLNNSKNVVTCSDDKTIRLYDVETGQSLQCLVGHKAFVFTLSAHPTTNLIVSGSYDETVRLWDPRVPDAIGEIEAHTEAVTSVDFVKDGTSFLSSSFDGLVRIWDTANLVCLKSFYAANAPPV